MLNYQRIILVLKYQLELSAEAARHSTATALTKLVLQRCFDLTHRTR